MNTVLEQIQKYKPKNTRVYVVGGYVRDLYLGITSKDIDLVTENDPFEIADRLYNEIENATKPVEYRTYNTVQLRIDDTVVELVRARNESYCEDCRKPYVSSGTLRDDIFRRDFTINALAFDIDDEESEIIDLTGYGVDDLNNGILRTPLDPNTTFKDDPLRILRLFRFIAKLGFSVERKTIVASMDNASRLQIVSRERIKDELVKLLSYTDPLQIQTALLLMKSAGVLEEIIPEIKEIYSVEQNPKYHDSTVFNHTLKVIEHLETSDPILRVAALLHDIGKGRTKEHVDNKGITFYDHETVGAEIAEAVLTNLKFSNEEIKRVTHLVRHHMRFLSMANSKVKLSNKTLRRAKLAMEPYTEDLYVLAIADSKASKTDQSEKKINKIKQVKQQIDNLPKFEEKGKVILPVDGNDVMLIFSTPQGTRVGKILQKISEMIINGELDPNDRENGIKVLTQLKGDGYGL